MSDSSSAEGSPDRTVVAGALSARTDAIEEAYEFFLAHAAQGLQAEVGAGLQIRHFLKQFDTAITGFGQFFTEHVRSLGVDPAPYRAFIGVIDRDAQDAQAAIGMVLAQPVIHSQMIDNLNANVHLRALLTDLFLIDEALKGQGAK